MPRGGTTSGRPRGLARLAHGRRRGIGVGEQEAGEPPGERRLADRPRGRRSARRARAAPRGRPTSISASARLVADQRWRMARMGRAREDVAFGRLVRLPAFSWRGLSPRRPDRAAPRPRPRCRPRPRPRTSARRRRRSARGSRRGDVEEGAAQRLDGSRSPPPRTGPRPPPRAAAPRPREPALGRAGRGSASGRGAFVPTATASSRAMNRQPAGRPPRPDRRGSNSANRSQTTHAPRSSAGRIVASRWSIRAAANSSASPSGPNGAREARQDHLAQRLGVRRAARLARPHDLEPEALAAALEPRAWTDLPAPSPPSRVMKRPRRRRGHF